MVMKKVRNENSTEAMRWGKMHLRMCIQNIPWNSITICKLSGFFCERPIKVAYYNKYIYRELWDALPTN
jgi:hypothetical protein